MAITSSQDLAVAATATALTSAESGAVSGGTVAVRNTHATVVVALGDSAVTDTTGFRLLPGATITADLSFGERLYGIRVGGTNGTVDVLRLGT